MQKCGKELENRTSWLGGQCREQRKRTSQTPPSQWDPSCLPLPSWSTPILGAWSCVMVAWQHYFSGNGVFKFSEHFPLALSICSYHHGVRAWQGLGLTYTKLCMSWSQPRRLCHCHVKLHHSRPLSACAHDTCQKLSNVSSFLHPDRLPGLDKEGMTFGMREKGAVPPPAVRLGFLSTYHSSDPVASSFRSARSGNQVWRQCGRERTWAHLLRGRCIVSKLDKRGWQEPSGALWRRAALGGEWRHSNHLHTWIPLHYFSCSIKVEKFGIRVLQNSRGFLGGRF